MTTAQLIALERQIAADRKRLHIAPVQLHVMPTWAKKRFLAVCGSRSFTNVEFSIPGPRIFDHWGQSLSGSLVGEPYYPVDNPELRAKVQQIATGLGVSFSIGSPWSSWWFPGKTVRVEFFETPDSTPLDQLRVAAKAAKKQGRCLLGCRYSSLGPSM